MLQSVPFKIIHILIHRYAEIEVVWKARFVITITVTYKVRTTLYVAFEFGTRNIL